MSNDEATRKNTADISAINAQLTGLSIEIKNMSIILNEIKEALRDMGKTYVSKDMCTLCHTQSTKDIKDLQDKQWWVYGAVLLGAFTVILELTKYIGGKL